MFVGVQVPLRVPNARIAQLVEHDLAKVGVAGSSPVSRSESKVLQKIVRPFFMPNILMERDERFIPMEIGKSRFSLRKSFTRNCVAFFVLKLHHALAWCFWFIRLDWL